MTCGYVCPKCEGNITCEDGQLCDWCTATTAASIEISDQEWITSVHESCVCSDTVKEDNLPA